ncbi:TIM barrel protein [Bradyrhizobium sp. OK095]|uniref:sugar phosphate isomerase/epimerase family protein n=1 Tax=Bradyrhizobium sp. OK095 TaxID=1882760 RepID=UPI0008CDB6CA|nr:TIM barrel protein [Bradyrhizobium sp. OK095]SEN83615.1 Sugar phosphate isomerase/epimerase [Bradyrhizobium sp. OK095]
MATFSLAALTVLDLAPPAMIELAARCGYEKVGLRLLPATPGGIAYRLMDDATLLRETLRRLQATGVTVADLEVVAFRPETDVASFTPFFETGARLGARHILVAAYDADLARFSDRYRQFCETAATYGLTSDLEFMPWTNVPDLKTAMRIVGEVDHPAAGILVDALHFDRSQSALADLRTIPVERLHYWQLCDGPAERPAPTEQLIHAAREERMFPGEGGIDLVGLTKAMPDSLTVSIEVPTVQLAKTVDAETRARRALAAGRAVVEKARAAS